MAAKVKKDSDFTLGKLYKGIVVERGLPAEAEGKLMKKKMPRYVTLCRQISKMVPGLGTQKKFPEAHSSAIEFLGWDLKPEEFSATVNFI
ncbi:MAG: hypothetical protein QXM75_03145, partial [Candidatus Diapherotrites archaeon]